jgi:hypothetical protein
VASTFPASRAFGVPIALSYCNRVHIPVCDNVPQEGNYLKRLILLASFAVLFTPFVASAHDWNGGDGDNHHRRRITATEMATAGFAAAALIGVVGYLALRKRNSL